MKKNRLKAFLGLRECREKMGGQYALVSFPKCGRTWLRLMIGRAIQLAYDLGNINPMELHKLATYHSEIPSMRVVHDEKPFWRTPEELSPSKETFKDKKVILLVRDPRDVVVSGFFEKKKRVHTYSERPPYQGTLSDYLQEPVGSFDTLLRYYQIWGRNQHVPQAFLLVRYEDIHENAVGELKRVLSFLDLHQVDPHVMKEAVQYASFDNMHKMEREDAFGTFRLRPGALEDNESYKTRKGKVGSFKQYLDANEIARLDGKMARELKGLFGYGAS